MKSKKTTLTIVKGLLIVFVISIVGVLTLPLIFGSMLERQQNTPLPTQPDPFPVTVHPKQKTIIEDATINAYLEGTSSPLQATALKGSSTFFDLLKKVATTIAEAPWYQNLASVAGINSKLITIPSGLRKEQVATLFAQALDWNDKQKQAFITTNKNATLPLPEGSYFPGTYYIQKGMTPAMVQDLVNKRFKENVLLHYSSSTAAIVPLDQALIVASIIQRETIGNEDMRLVSGIIWNRLFTNMNLQVDATLQYAKANTTDTNVWWPQVEPNDKYIKSPFNTYLHSGLPPEPISNPSVGAILAALNPIKTPCYYYFNDTAGEFHCSITYNEHLTLLKQYYDVGN